MDFSRALHYLKSGHKMCREGWISRDKYIYVSKDGRALRINYPKYDMDSFWRGSFIDIMKNDWEFLDEQEK